MAENCKVDPVCIAAPCGEMATDFTVLGYAKRGRKKSARIRRCFTVFLELIWVPIGLKQRLIKTST
jgi:hypothetical protein